LSQVPKAPKLVNSTARPAVHSFPNDPPLPVFEKTRFGAFRAARGSADAYARNLIAIESIMGQSKDERQFSPAA
jgi:hypothetical protein